MLEIEYLGGNSVKYTTKKRTLIIDPDMSSIGRKTPAAKDDTVFLATEQRFLPGSDALELEGPGEYEVGPFSIRGTSAKRMIDTESDESNTTIYHIDSHDIRTAVLGNCAAKLTDEQLEVIGVVDVLIVPVGGGGYTLDAKDAAAIVRNVGPKVVIPVHYADAALHYEVPQDDLKEFVSELGAPVETAPRLKLKSAASLPPSLTVYHLERA